MLISFNISGIISVKGFLVWEIQIFILNFLWKKLIFYQPLLKSSFIHQFISLKTKILRLSNSNPMKSKVYLSVLHLLLKTAVCSCYSVFGLDLRRLKIRSMLTILVSKKIVQFLININNLISFVFFLIHKIQFFAVSCKKVK